MLENLFSSPMMLPKNKLERLSLQVFLLVEPDLTVVSYKNQFLV